jgi:hypothetical protein
MVRLVERPSLLRQLRRDFVHSKNLELVLKSLARRLNEEGIPFAVVGGLAVRHHGYARFTEDIDVLTTPEGLEQIHDRLVGRGYLPRARGLRKKLRETEHDVNIDVLVAGEHAGAAESPVVYPTPKPGEFARVEGYLIPKLPLLIAFKLASGTWGHRPQDFADVHALIRINGLTRGFARKLPPSLRPKFLELLAEARREKELE